MNRKSCPILKALSVPVLVFFTVLFNSCAINFDNLTAGTEYHVNDTFASCNITMTVEKFCWANGQWTDQGKAKITGGHFAGGSGNDVNLNNVNLSFGLPYPVNKITVKLGDYGGNLNLRVNGAFTNLNDFNLLNGGVIGGASVIVAYSFINTSKKIGFMELSGSITEFKIGGQELWIDDVVYQK